MTCGNCGIQASAAMQGDTGVPAGAPTTGARARCPHCRAFIAQEGAPCTNSRCRSRRASTPVQQQNMAAVAAAPPRPHRGRGTGRASPSPGRPAPGGAAGRGGQLSGDEIARLYDLATGDAMPQRPVEAAFVMAAKQSGVVTSLVAELLRTRMALDKAMRQAAAARPPAPPAPHDYPVKGERARFGDLAIGQLCCPLADADYTLQRLRDGARCVETGHRADVAAEEEVEVVEDAPILHDTVTEIERAALTLLAHRPANHPLLVRWITALQENPAEMRSLDEYVRAECAAAELQEIAAAGYAVPGADWRDTLSGRILDRRAASVLPGPGERLADVAPEVDWLNAQDRLSLSLAYEVQQYRYMARPAGDRAFTIQGMGGPLLAGTTSLAAALVEYSEGALNLAYTRHE